MYLCMKLWGLDLNLTPLRQRCSIFNERNYAKLFLVLLTYPFHTEMPENNNWGKIISMCLQYSQYYKLANIAFLIYKNSVFFVKHNRRLLYRLWWCPLQMNILKTNWSHIDLISIYYKLCFYGCCHTCFTNFFKIRKKLLVNYWKRWGKAKVMKLIVTELD